VFSVTSETLRQALERVRQGGAAVRVEELAQAILALDAPIDRPLARRIVAAALGRPEVSLPDRLEARHVRPAEEAAVTDVPLERAEFVVVDLETTGLSPARSAILEIGAVRVSRLRVAGRFQTLVRPPGPLSRAIADLTGIDDAMVADAPTARPAVGGFRRWLERAGSAPFVAHNARFDAGFVERALDDLALPPLRVPVLCTQRLARRIVPELGRYNLDHVCAHFGIRNPARHRALGDARATAALLIDLLQLVRLREGIETVGELLDFQARRIRRARAPRRSAGALRQPSR
jgi:DNA polymerase-3 subunit epsilon